METNIHAGGMITRVLPTSAVAHRGLVQIGFLLKDTLNIWQDSDREELVMSQCCYEQKTISMDSSQVDDMGCVQRVVYQVLHRSLHMNVQPDDPACPSIASTIADLVQRAKRTDPSFGVVSLHINIDSVTDKPNQRRGGPMGEHGYARLMQRCSEVCAKCTYGFNTPKDITVTTCHHVFHGRCIFQWLNDSSHSCPVCEFNLAPMLGKQIRFE